MADTDDDLQRRLDAVERALDGEPGQHRQPDTDDTDALAARVATLEARVDELDAAIQAVRGFLGGVSAVNEAVERRADAAVAAVERLETRLDGEGGTPIDETSSRTGIDEPDSEESNQGQPAQGLRERLRGLR